MTIISRGEKGSELTYSEMDANIEELRDIPAGKVFPKDKNVGIQIDTASPDWGWHDLMAMGFIDPNSVNQPTFATYRGGISEFQFSEGDEMLARFHLPHDYAPGTDMLIHVHCSHNSTLVTGGSVTFGWEVSYSKGHNQAAFSDPVFITVSQSANPIQYQHIVAETAQSISGGSATQLNCDYLEVDGVIISRFYVDSNDLTVSGGGVPDPFIHFVDVHYQSTGLPTKQKAPDFWT